MNSKTKQKLSVLLVLLALLTSAIIVTNCRGPIGQGGPAGPQGTSSGTIAGKVTSALTGSAISGVTVITEPLIQDATVTDSDGAFSIDLPVGVYTVTFNKKNYESLTQTASVIAGKTISRNIILKPLNRVMVNPGQPQTAAPGANVSLKATAEPLDGSTITSYQWTQVDGVKAVLANEKTETLTATLASAADYQDKLIGLLELTERFMVQPINPHALGTARLSTFKITVSTSSGNYSATVTVLANLPYAVSTGLNNVAQGTPVLLNGKNQAAYAWELSAPAGSKATLQYASSRNPLFTPDVSDNYTLSEKRSGTVVKVYAGTWASAVTGQDDSGRPAANNCVACHNGTNAPDMFTPWAQSGHAEIFTQNLNSNAYHGDACFACHTVGFDKTASNGGFDDASDYAAFFASDLLKSADADNWANMLQQYPEAARLANIQCESCHGPNNSPLHGNGKLDTARISVSADVCGSCHGEPARHGRFQQWELSGHSNIELAVEEASVEKRGATAGHCGRCHSAQGFLAWIEQDDLTKVIQGENGNATVDELKALGLTTDTVQPQTCVTCHDPHNPGTVSGEPTNATVRIQDITGKLPAGFEANAVGKGALCITCHNTRNGPHNDLFPTNQPTNYSAPHTAAQGDVLLGQSAYLVDVERRSPHASVKDTCVTCHMEATPPPPLLSYQQSGTNHSFKASNTICSSCHSAAFSGEAFQTSAENKLRELEQKMADYILKKIGTSVTIKDYTPHESGGKSYDVKSDAVVINKDNIASLTPTEPHGQQGFLVNFKTPVSVTYKPANEEPHSVSLTAAAVQLGDFTTDGKTPVIPVSDILVKVGWNYFLIHSDGSKGVHNPEFVDDVLRASLNALP